MSETTMPPYAAIRRIRTTVRREGVAPGYLFMSPQSILEPAAPHGPQIADDRGRVVWFRPMPEGRYATNVRVQTYRGEPVLTWWEGEANRTGAGYGTCHIADTRYRVIASFTAGGHPADLHELTLTERDTALVVSYRTRTWDLTSVGGRTDGQVIDSVVEEIDVASGEVLLHWSGLDHIPLSESDVPVALAGDGPWDHLHVNGVAVDEDGNLIVTARSSQAVYKIDRSTGEVLWKLGGGASTLVLGVGARCNWPHDAHPTGAGVYRIFDNGANVGMEGYESRVVWIHADPARGVATHVRQITHPEHLSSSVEGNAQGLPNGNTLVGWGRAGRISEFSADGELLFDAMTPDGNGWTTYRVFRHEWHGRPVTPPEAVLDGDQVHAVWNGATGVARWRLLAGPGEDALREAGVVEWDGFQTPMKLPAGTSACRVEALDADGRVIGRSPITR